MTYTFDEIETAVDHALIAWLWSELNAEGEPLDAELSIHDVLPHERAKWHGELAAFMNLNLDDVRASGQSLEQIGHDFTLTRNGHGAGFWDRGLGDIGKRLTEACKPYGEAHAYVSVDEGVAPKVMRDL